MSTSDQLAALSGHHNPDTPATGRPSRVWVADVVTVNPDGTIDVQPIASRGTRSQIPVHQGYKPTVGDRVLVADLNGDRRLPHVVQAITSVAPTLSYSRSGAGETAAVAAIRQALASLGLVTDNTTP